MLTVKRTGSIHRHVQTQLLVLGFPVWRPSGNCGLNRQHSPRRAVAAVFITVLFRRYVPEYFNEITNPIRRFYKWPLNTLFEKLQPVMVRNTLAFRSFNSTQRSCCSAFVKDGHSCMGVAAGSAWGAGHPQARQIPSSAPSGFVRF